MNNCNSGEGIGSILNSGNPVGFAGNLVKYAAMCILLQGCPNQSPKVVEIPNSCKSPTFYPVEEVEVGGNAMFKEYKGVLTVECETTKEGITEILYYGNMPVNGNGVAEKYQIFPVESIYADGNIKLCSIPKNCSNLHIDPIKPYHEWMNYSFGEEKLNGTITVSCKDAEGNETLFEETGIDIATLGLNNPAIGFQKAGSLNDEMTCW